MGPNQTTQPKPDRAVETDFSRIRPPTQSYSQPKPESYRIRPELLSCFSLLYILRTVWATFLAFGARGSKVGSGAGRFW